MSGRKSARFIKMRDSATEFFNRTDCHSSLLCQKKKADDKLQRVNWPMPWNLTNRAD